MSLKTTVGAFDAESRTVSVTFKDGAIRHIRTINAAVDGEGKYLRAETQDIIDQQAAGVAEKIRLGIIT
ncbi:MAG: hypothetical protein AB7E05_14250 [Sphingobium sp.]